MLKYLWQKDADVYDSSLHRIDAKKYFNASVQACLFITYTGKSASTKNAAVYSDLNFSNMISVLGSYRNELIADIAEYEKYRHIEGTAHRQWRSGIKHDASKVMELSYQKDSLVNGFGKKVSIEEDYIYPLLKSSDLGNGRLNPRKYVIVTQKKAGGDTSYLRDNAPNLWAYLEEYGDILDQRKSIIYQKRPKFSIFGIGDYSFSPWKAAISGLYKSLRFSLIGTESDKAVMLDDTCYFIPCYSEKEAYSLERLLNSETCRRFLKSLIFFDAKRPVTIEILRRIDLKKLAEHLREESRVDVSAFNA